MRTHALICIALLTVATTIAAPPSTKEEAYAWSEKKAQNLCDQYFELKKEIQQLQGEARSLAHENLELTAAVMFFDVRYGFSGQEFDGRETNNLHFVDAIYATFINDQNHLKRTIIHTDQGATAIELLKERMSSLVALYPVSKPTAFVERMQFLVVLCRSYPHIPDVVDGLMRENLTRWQGEDRIPALLFVSRKGNAAAKQELESFTSKEAKRLRTLFDVHEKHFVSKSD